MICELCGSKGARLRALTRNYGSGEHLLIIENIPSISCPHCGGSYLTAETLKEIERIRRDRHRLATPRRVAVAQFERC